MSKPVILLDAGELVALPGANDGDVLTWNGTTNAWQSSPGGNVGTVTSVALDTAATGLTVSGGTTQTITGAGTFTLGGTLGAGYGGTGLGAPVSGDAGKVLAATAGGGYELVTNGNGTVTSVTAGAGLDGGTITTSGTISMPNIGTAGAYGSASSVPVITTDAQGRVTGVVPTAIAIAQSAVADLVSDLAGKVPTSTQVIAGTGLSGGGALSGNVTLSLPSVGTQGEYGSASSVAVITTDQQGRVSAATTTAIAITQSQVADLVTDLGNKADKSVTATAGDGLTGGGTLATNFSFALETVGSSQIGLGSESKTVTITTDAYGRVTSLSEQDIANLPASVITSGQLGLSRGGTGIDATSVQEGQLLVGGMGTLAVQSLSKDGSLDSTGELTVTGLQGNQVGAGTLGVVDAGKALIWSGSAWQAAAIPGGGGGGGGGLTLYCNYAASSPYVLDTTFDEHAQWNTGAITVANDANGTELARFLTPSSFVVEVIPVGIWDLNVYVQASGATNDTAIRAKVGIWDGSTLTVLGTSDYVYVTDPTVLTQYKASVYVPTYDMASGERIAVVIEGRRFAATTQTVTSYFGVGAISHVHSTLNAPGGTGLLKVVNGYLQSPASLLVNADVATSAAIAVSKLAAGTNTYVLTTVLGVPTWSPPPATGVTSLTGTANQVLVGGTSGTPQTGALTLTLPTTIRPTSNNTALAQTITGGNTTSTTNSGGALVLQGGTGGSTSGNGGTLYVRGGAAGSSGTEGEIRIGDSSTSVIRIGTILNSTVINGGLTLSSLSGYLKGNGSSAVTASSTISASDLSGTVSVSNGGTGRSTLTAGNLYLGAGTSPMSALAGTDVNDLVQWNGTTWARSAGQALGTTAEPSFVGVTATSRLTLGSELFVSSASGDLLLNSTTQNFVKLYMSSGKSLFIQGGATALNDEAGAITITAGSNVKAGGTGGRVIINAGSGDTDGVIWIGNQNTQQISIGEDLNTTQVSIFGDLCGIYSPTLFTKKVTLAGGLQNPLNAVDGGTGQLSYTVGDLLYADSSSTLAKLSDVATGNALISGGVGVAPSWGKVDLTTHVSGTLPVANGGTNNDSLSVTQGTVYYGDGTKLVGLAPGAAGYFLKTNGAGSSPEWAAMAATDVTSVTGTANQVLVNNTSGTPQTGAVTLTLPTSIRPDSASIGKTLTVTGGDSSVSDNWGGDLSLRGGVSGGGTGNGGNVYVLGGSNNGGTGQNGGVEIGTSYTSTVYIGQIGVTDNVIAGTGTTFLGDITLSNLNGYVKGNGGSGVATASATIPTSDLSGSIALGAQVSGTLPIANGGTGAASTSQNYVFAGPTSGSGAPSFRALVAGDVAGLTPYDLRGKFVGTPGSGVILDTFIADRAVTISSTSTDHKFSAKTPPTTSDVVITVQRTRTTLGVPTTSTIFTATSASTDTVLNGYYTMTISTPITVTDIAVDDVIEVVMQSGAVDAGFSTPVWTIKATA